MDTIKIGKNKYFVKIENVWVNVDAISNIESNWDARENRYNSIIILNFSNERIYVYKDPGDLLHEISSSCSAKDI